MLLLLAFVGGTFASFCGDSAVPFSLEILPDGQPVLGCARPSCFGWKNDGTPFSENARFYRINKRPDGFMRKGKETVAAVGSSRFAMQHAICDSTFESANCDQDSQWVAGIAPQINVTHDMIAVQCCSLDALRSSSDRGVATVHNGQIVIGGEVSKNGKQFAFDYISDLGKTVNRDGSVSYDVFIRRFDCPDRLEETAFEEFAHVIEPEKVALQIPNYDDLSDNKVGGSNFIDETAGDLQELPSSLSSPSLFPFTANEGRNKYSQPAAKVGKVVGNVRAHGASIYRPSGGYASGPSLDTLQVIEPPPVQNTVGGGQYASAPVVQNALPVAQEPIIEPQPPLVQQPVQPPPQLYTGQPVFYPVQPNVGGGGGVGGGACCGGGFASSYYCFADDTVVRLHSGQIKRMDELKVDDYIETINDTNVVFGPVTFWLHRNPSQKAEFLKIDLEDGSSLKITAKHYIYKSNCDADQKLIKNLQKQAVFAEKVSVGDCLYKLNDDTSVALSRVKNITKVWQRGIYAPMLTDGKLFVNGILASCHNIIQTDTVTQAFFSYVDEAFNMYNRFFGVETDGVRELPIGIDTLVALAEFVLPKHIAF